MISIKEMPHLYNPTYLHIDYDDYDDYQVINIILLIDDRKVLISTCLNEIYQIRKYLQSMSRSKIFETYMKMDDLVDSNRSNLMNIKNELVVYSVLKEILYNEEIVVYV